MKDKTQKTANKKEPNTKIVSKVQSITVAKRSPQIDVWQNALRSAQNKSNPNRARLYNLYSEALLNPHLSAVLNKRITAITNANIKFMIDGKENDELSRHFKQPWFGFMLKQILNAKFWGHSLLEFTFIDGKIHNCFLVPRANVRPETGYVYIRANEDKSKINYKRFVKQLLEVGEPHDLGMLNKAMPYTIWLKNNFGDWATYNEMFGFPYRIGEYDPQFPQSKNDMETALKTSGAAAYIVAPNTGQVKLLQSNSTGSAHTFEHLAKMCNAELSKLFLGQTMTTEDGSSKSQASVHKQVEEQINAADMLFIENILNHDFKNLLLLNGYKVESGEFQFDRTEQLSIEQQLNIALKINKVAPIDKNYWAETFNIPLSNEPTEKAVEKPSKKKALNYTLLFQTDSINQLCDHIDELPENLKDTGSILGDLSDLIEDLANKIYNKHKFKNGVFAPLYRLVSDKLIEAFGIGFKNGSGDVDFKTKDKAFLSKLESNIYRFSAAKNKTMLAVMNQALKGKDGKPLPFNQFKTSVKRLNIVFNQNWLKTEYNFAIASAQMAANWKRIQTAKKEFPYLRYVTVGDKRVRPAHQSLDGLTFDVDHTFWDTMYPPNGWNCRCEVEQLEKSEAKTSTNKQAETAIKAANPDPYFQTNTAKQSVIFSEQHPYFKIASNG